MARRRKDALEKPIEKALAPGAFIGDRESWDFVEGLDAARMRIVALIEKDEGARAVRLLETFLAGCYEKSEEIEDSTGSFGLFVEELLCDWIRARQAAAADPDETASMLLSWMEHDEYGYCDGLENEAVGALDRARERWDQKAGRRRRS